MHAGTPSRAHADDMLKIRQFGSLKMPWRALRELGRECVQHAKVVARLKLLVGY